MENAIVNLTDPHDIVSACKKKGGKNGVSVCAKECGYTVAYISMHIHRNREAEPVLQAIANWLRCGIYGVMPNETAISGVAKGGKM